MTPREYLVDILTIAVPAMASADSTPDQDRRFAASLVDALDQYLASQRSSLETSEGHYVEELIDGHWRRSALGHMWQTEDDARTQLTELRRRYGGKVFRLHGDSI